MNARDWKRQMESKALLWHSVVEEIPTLIREFYLGKTDPVIQ